MNLVSLRFDMLEFFARLSSNFVQAGGSLFRLRKSIFTMLRDPKLAKVLYAFDSNFVLNTTLSVPSQIKRSLS